MSVVCKAVVGSNRLPVLASSINEHLVAAEQATRRGLEHAIAARAAGPKFLHAPTNSWHKGACLTGQESAREIPSAGSLWIFPQRTPKIANLMPRNRVRTRRPSLLGGLADLRAVRRERQACHREDVLRSPAVPLGPGGKPRMTTEIAILNRQGIALAADSAVTIGRQKVWKTANKLFSLAPHNDIAVMAYGSGDFISFPWETIVKCFRQKVGPKQFMTVKECAEELIRYLESDDFQNSGSENVSILFLFMTHLERLKDRVGEYQKTGGYQSKKEFRQKLCDQVSWAKQRLNDGPVFLNMATLKDFKKTYQTMVLEVAKDVFKEVITPQVLKALTEFCFEIFRRQWPSDYETGLVVAGFGKNEFFPVVVTYMVDGKHNKTLRAWRADDYCHDINDPNQSDGVIIPFGQRDVAFLFLDGIVQRHLRWLSRSLRLLLDAKSKSLVDKFIADQGQKNNEIAVQRNDNQALLKKFEDEFWPAPGSEDTELARIIHDGVDFWR
jgi:hypothetical protein